jgi:hypothetical protein
VGLFSQILTIGYKGAFHPLSGLLKEIRNRSRNRAKANTDLSSGFWGQAQPTQLLMRIMEVVGDLLAYCSGGLRFFDNHLFLLETLKVGGSIRDIGCLPKQGHAKSNG